MPQNSLPGHKERSHASIQGWYEQHPLDDEIDNTGLHNFYLACRTKMAEARARGRRGWNEPHVTEQALSDALFEHVLKGDPVDVANFCMFLHQRGERIARPTHYRIIAVQGEQS